MAHRPGLLDSIPLNLKPTSDHVRRICVICMFDLTDFRVAGVSVHPSCWREHRMSKGVAA